MNRSELKSVIVLPDMQVPYEDRISLSAVEAYMSDTSWDIYINLGDFLDFDCISSFNKGFLRKIEGLAIQKDYDYANKILDRHQKIVRENNKNAQFVLLEGNHEYRVERYIDENPQVRGLLEVERGLKLRDRCFKWVRCYRNGDVYRLGNAVFHHGRFINQYHAAKTVNYYGTNIFYGHTHDVQGFSKVTHGDDKTMVGQSLGCLCRYDQSYIQGNPTNWQQAFGVFYFLPDGHFTYYIIRIFKNRFVSPEGKIYDGRKLYKRRTK